MYPSQISQMTKEFLELESPGLAVLEEGVAVAVRGSGVIEMLGWCTVFVCLFVFCCCKKSGCFRNN